jgi:uncharacterized protein (UPF0335 family)
VAVDARRRHTVPAHLSPAAHFFRKEHIMSNSGIAADQLRAFIERIERLEEEKKSIADDIKDVYAEAKGNGFDVAILRKVISLRKKALHEREEEEAILDLYLQALGMASS